MRREHILIFFILLGLTQLTFSNSENSKFRYSWSNKQRIFKSEIKLQKKDSLEKIKTWLEENNEKFQISQTSVEKNQIRFSSDRIYKDLGGYKLNFTMLMILNEEVLRLKLSFNNAKTFRGFTYVPPQKRVDEILKEMKELKIALVSYINNGDIMDTQTEISEDTKITEPSSNLNMEVSTNNSSENLELETLKENDLNIEINQNEKETGSTDSSRTEINAEIMDTDSTSENVENKDTAEETEEIEDTEKTTETPKEDVEDGFSW